MRLLCLAPFAALLLACGDDLDARPDPSGTSSGAGGATSSSSGSAGGNETAALGYENGTRLRARVVTGNDGSKQFLGWHDTAYDAPCSYQPIEGVMRCAPSNLPVGMAIGGYFSDAACSAPLAYSASPCGDAIGRYGTAYIGVACLEPTYTARRITSAHNGTVYQDVNGTCTEVVSPPANRWVTAQIPGADLVSGPVEIE